MLKDFTNATIITNEGTLSETAWIFKKWEKNGMSRIYVNYRGKKSYGYIDLTDGSNHVDSNENAQEAVRLFKEKYM